MGRRRIVGSIITLGSLVLIVALSGSLFEQWLRRDVVQERKDALQKVEEEHARLLKDLREATSSAFIEKQAREKLGLVKEGETVILIEETKGRGDDPPATPGEAWRAGETREKQNSLPNWKKWIRLFF